MVSRRRVLAGCPALLVGVGGCSALGNDALALGDLEFELVNNTDEPQLFHYAFETSDGIEAWTSRSVPASDTVWMDRDSVPTSAVSLHVVVDDTPLQASLDSYEETGYIMVEYGNHDEPRVVGFTGDNAPETPTDGPDR